MPVKPAVTLATGIYKLSRAVKNPHPDRRVKYDWTAWPKWPEGMEFKIEIRTLLKPSEVPADLDPAMFEYRVIQPGKHGKTLSEPKGETNEAGDLFYALVEALVPVGMTLDGLLADNAAEDILRKLLASGKVTLNDLAEAAEA